MEKIKVIFLDIDGVLNDDNTVETINGYQFVDNDKIERLCAIIDCTGAKVVLSSDWRACWVKYHEVDDELAALAARLDKFGVHIFDFTGDFRWTRGNEITNWLNSDIKEHYEITNYCILDDLPAREFQDHYVHVVHCDPTEGLQDKQVEQAIAILNRGE